MKVKVSFASIIHLSMEFSRHEYWDGEPFPSPGDPPDPEVKPGSPTLQADSSSSEPCPGRGNSKFKGPEAEICWT